MKDQKEEYFLNVQKVERELIQQLFTNYFAKRGCKDLSTTPLTGFSKYDGEFTSGMSKVMFEFKRRNILSTKYSDSFIESYKFFELFKKHKADNYTLFIIEYDDHYFLFDLQYEFMMYKAFDNPVHRYSFFNQLKASTNQFNSNKKSDKYIRYLPFHQARVILDKDFNQIDYKTYLSFRIK